MIGFVLALCFLLPLWLLCRVISSLFHFVAIDRPTVLLMW